MSKINTNALRIIRRIGNIKLLDNNYNTLVFFIIIILELQRTESYYCKLTDVIQFYVSS